MQCVAHTKYDNFDLSKCVLNGRVAVRKEYQSCRKRFSLLDDTIRKQIQADYVLVIGFELW